MYAAIASFLTKLQANIWYAFTLVLLAFTGLGLLIYEFTPYATPELVTITTKIDLVIAYIFLTDFFLGLFFNTTYTKKEYWKKNWLDFISSIPVTADAARALRILRVVRALRVISSALDIWFTHKRYQQIRNGNKKQ